MLVDHAMRILPIIAVASVGLIGCANSKRTVIKQASFDHDCPEREIRVLEENPSIWAYRLEVCGKQKKYRLLGEHSQFVDVTNEIPKSE